MKTIPLISGTSLLAALIFAGCTQNPVASNSNARPATAAGRRAITGSNVPRPVGRPVGYGLATTSPYTHADDVNRELGITTPAADTATR